MSIDFDAVSPDVEAYPVVITIARDFGAEGHEIGKMLSLELGIPFYDNELLVRASERAGSSVSDAAAYDEQVAAELFAFLPDRMDARVEIVRAKRGWDAKKAKKLVKKMQRGREAFYERYSKGKCGLHDNKDLVVNRARFGRQGCVDIIAAAYRTKVAAVEAAAAAADAGPGSADQKIEG